MVGSLYLIMFTYITRAWVLLKRYYFTAADNTAAAFRQLVMQLFSANSNAKDW